MAFLELDVADTLTGVICALLSAAALWFASVSSIRGLQQTEGGLFATTILLNCTRVIFAAVLLFRLIPSKNSTWMRSTQGVVPAFWKLDVGRYSLITAAAFFSFASACGAHIVAFSVIALALALESMPSALHLRRLNRLLLYLFRAAGLVCMDSALRMTVPFLPRASVVVLATTCAGSCGSIRILTSTQTPEKMTSTPNGNKSSARRRKRGNVSQTQGKRSTTGIAKRLGLAALFPIIWSVIAHNILVPAGMSVRERSLRPSMPEGYQLIEQKESTTGLLSVVEDTTRKFRFLTCDHSVLGGRYFLPGSEGENIYGQFHLHEAVRLTRKASEQPGLRTGGTNGRALCIGLGVGVVADALAKLGSPFVEAVEIDPVVHDYAKRYFDLDDQVQVHEEDALIYLERTENLVKNNEMKPFDYVIHDVFTGGSVPSELFSIETLQRIRSIMQDDSVLAVNFVGVLGDQNENKSNSIEVEQASKAVLAVATRLQKVFPFVRCFSDGFKFDDRVGVNNFVFFASVHENRVQFRRHTNADLMGSSIREGVLNDFRKYEVDLSEMLQNLTEQDNPDEMLDAGQRITAWEHWKIMRDEFTDTLWGAIAR